MFFPYQLVVMPWVLTFLCADFACTQLANVVQKSVYNIILSMIYHFFSFRRFWPFLTMRRSPLRMAIYPEDLHLRRFSGFTGAVSTLKPHFYDFFSICTRKTSFCRKPIGNPVPKSYFSTKMFVPGFSENRFSKKFLVTTCCLNFFTYIFFLSIFFLLTIFFYVLCFSVNTFC